MFRQICLRARNTSFCASDSSFRHRRSGFFENSQNPFPLARIKILVSSQLLCNFFRNLRINEVVQQIGSLQHLTRSLLSQPEFVQMQKLHPVEFRMNVFAKPRHVFSKMEVAVILQTLAGFVRDSETFSVLEIWMSVKSKPNSVPTSTTTVPEKSWVRVLVRVVVWTAGEVEVEVAVR